MPPDSTQGDDEAKWAWFETQREDPIFSFVERQKEKEPDRKDDVKDNGHEYCVLMIPDSTQEDDEAKWVWFETPWGHPRLRVPLFSFRERKNAKQRKSDCKKLLRQMTAVKNDGHEYCVLSPMQLVLVAHYLYCQRPSAQKWFTPEELACFASIGHVVNKKNLQSTLVKMAQRVQTQQVRARRQASLTPAHRRSSKP